MYGEKNTLKVSSVRKPDSFCTLPPVVISLFYPRTLKMKNKTNFKNDFRYLRVHVLYERIVNLQTDQLSFVRALNVIMFIALGTRTVTITDYT
jgi:hypothetical protein